jgi:hypothetical protein
MSVLLQEVHFKHQGRGSNNAMRRMFLLKAFVLWHLGDMYGHSRLFCTLRLTQACPRCSSST